MSTEDEWCEKHDDGHTLDMAVAVREGSGGCYTEVQPVVHCPDDSFCKRWSETHGAPDFCFITNEIGAVSWIDFIETMQTAGLPDDWSRGFPIGIEWRDRGEDGLEWWPKPVVTPLDALRKLTEQVEMALHAMRKPIQAALDSSEEGELPPDDVESVASVLDALEMMVKGDPGCNDDNPLDQMIRKARG